MSGGKVQRALGEQAHELLAQLVDAVARLGADRVQRVEAAERRRGLHLRGDVPGLQAVDLVQRDHDGDAEREDALGDEAITAADAVATVEHEEHALHVLERLVDRSLQVLGEQVARPLEPRQVGEDELVLRPVRDPEDTPARRLRLVRDDRDLAAAERVHERRLPDVRPTRDGDEPGPHQKKSWKTARVTRAPSRPP